MSEIEFVYLYKNIYTNVLCAYATATSMTYEYTVRITNL